MLNFHRIYEKSNNLMACSTCKYEGKCKRQCICLKNLNEIKNHEKYPLVKKRIPYFDYKFWEPKESMKKKSELLLTDEDFEL